MRNKNEEEDHNAALTEVVTESALVPTPAPHDGVSDERRIFTAGWSAGFQEALEPDRYPDRDRCEDAFREWTLLRADELASPPTTEALTNRTRRGEHGTDCTKVAHWRHGAFLHPEDHDGPYEIDHVQYCGRCHAWMGTQIVVVER
jgi:hypothetical protein